MVSRVQLTVYDKAFTKIGPVGDVDVAIVLRHMAVGTLRFVLPASHRRFPALVARGSRVVATLDGVHVMSGHVTEMSGEATGAWDSVWEFTVSDDIAEILALRGLPDPANPVTAQTKDYDRRSGPAETVFKDAVAANAAAFGIPLTCAPSQGRGLHVDASWRFHRILDRIDLGSLGVTVRQSGTGLVADVYQTQSRTQVLGPGVIPEWQSVITAPETTRVLAGAQGDGAARVIRAVTSPGDESAWGMVRVAWMDARDLDTLTPEQSAEMTNRMRKELREGRAALATKVALQESDAFRWRHNYNLGDSVRLRLSPHVGVIEDSITEIRVRTVGDGVAITPIVGDISVLDPYVRSARKLHSMTARMTQIETGK